MVSSESVAPMRFIWVRYQPELTLPVPFRDQIRDFDSDFGLSEPSNPATLCLAHTECGLATQNAVSYTHLTLPTILRV